MSTTLEKIRHYQRSIEKYTDNEERMLHCISKLYSLPVTVQHLQQTGVGRTVNGLRKYNGGVGNAAKALVYKWKAMVVDEATSEEDDEDEACVPDAPESYNNDNPDDDDKKNELQESHTSRREEAKVEEPRNKYGHKSEKNPASESSKSVKGEPEKSKHDKSDKKTEKHSSKHESKSDKRSSSKESKGKVEDTKKIKESVVAHTSESRKSDDKDSSKKRKLEDSKSEQIDNKKRRASTETNHSVDELSSPDKHKGHSSSAVKIEIKQEKIDTKEKHHNSNKSKSSSSGSSSGKSKDGERQKTDEHHGKNDKKDGSSHHSHKDGKHSKSSSTSKDHLGGKEKHKKKDQKDEKEKKIKQEVVDEEINSKSGKSFAEALDICMTTKAYRKRNNNSPTGTPSKFSKAGSSSPSSSTDNKKLSVIKTEPTCSATLTDRPSLLGPNVKLEPLNVDLASTLPEISPNYKPLPCINSSQRRDEDRALTDVMYVKNQRTKVYSGNKSGYTSVPSLYELCIRVLIENIDALEFTGGVPYDIIKPVLERATADQLFMLEHYNPYLIEDTDSLWQFHCSREFRNKQREEMESWREMYMRCLDEREAKLKALTANIKQSIDRSAPVRSTKLAYVDNVVKPPRNVLKKQAKYGTANSSSNPTSDLKKKLVGGGPAAATNISVPPPPVARSRVTASGTVKKTKAPLMAKALQLIKGRYRR